MKSRRIAYLMAWLCALVFLLLYRQWLAWVVLIALLALPLFSLLVSLPAMLSAKLDISAPETLEMHSRCRIGLVCRGALPVPYWKCHLRVVRPLTGECFDLKSWNFLPTEHCGELQCNARRSRVYDYLGLFGLPLKPCRELRVLVRPQSIPIPEERIQTPQLVCLWKPKPGGFAENHELRLYRPGDSIRHIHWKLSAKSGKLIYREPMIPQPGKILVRLVLGGSAEELDRTLGRFLWLGEYLLNRSILFEVRCLSGQGMDTFPVNSLRDLDTALDAMLRLPMAPADARLPKAEPAVWQFDLGGEPDET